MLLCVEGEVHGTLHREVWEQYGGQLQPGSVLVLRQVGVLSTGITARRHYLNVTCNNIINIYSNVLSDKSMGDHSSGVRVTRVHQVTHSDLLKSASDWQACHAAPEISPICSPVNSMFSTAGHPANFSIPHHTLKQSENITGNASPLSSCLKGWQQIRSIAPNLAHGTTVVQTADRMLCHSVNSRTANSSNGKSCTSTLVNSSIPFNRRVMDGTEQSVCGESASSGQNASYLLQQIQKEKLSDNKSFKFQPQLTLASCGRKVSDSSLQSDEGKATRNEVFEFQPQQTPFSSNRTDTMAPKFKGGFTPKMSCFQNSAASVSQVSSPSQVPTAARTSFEVSDSSRTSKPTINIVNHLQETPTLSVSSNSADAKGLYFSSKNASASGKFMTEVESSVLDVLEGFDTSALFDEF